MADVIPRGRTAKLRQLADLAGRAGRVPQSRREYWQPELTRNQQRDDRVRESWIVGLIEAVEQAIRRD